MRLMSGGRDRQRLVGVMYGLNGEPGRDDLPRQNGRHAHATALWSFPARGLRYRSQEERSGLSRDSGPDRTCATGNGARLQSAETKWKSPPARSAVFARRKGTLPTALRDSLQPLTADGAVWRKQRFAAHRDLRKNMAVLVALGEALPVAPGDVAVDAFRIEHVDVARLRAALEGCVSFDRWETRGLSDAMRVGIRG